MADARPRLRRTDLFPTPIWTTDLTAFVPRAASMAAVAEQVLAAHPAGEGELFTQSAAVLQDTDDRDWTELFALLGAEMELIVAREMPVRYGIERAFLRSWVLRIDDAAEYRRTGTALNPLHSHLPALLSSVLYVQVPEALVDRPYGGTSFRDPCAVTTRAHRTPEVHISPRPMRLVVFPSHLEHLPEPVPVDVDLDRPRIVVATDLRVHAA